MLWQYQVWKCEELRPAVPIGTSGFSHARNYDSTRYCYFLICFRQVGWGLPVQLVPCGLWSVLQARIVAVPHGQLRLTVSTSDHDGVVRLLHVLCAQSGVPRLRSAPSRWLWWVNDEISKGLEFPRRLRIQDSLFPRFGQFHGSVNRAILNRRLFLLLFVCPAFE